MIKLLDMMVPVSSGFYAGFGAPGGIAYPAVKRGAEERVCLGIRA